MPTKAVPITLQLSAQFSKIINLAIEDDNHRPFGSNHRLMPERRDIQNRKPHMPKPDPGPLIDEQAGIIWSAMRNTIPAKQKGVATKIPRISNNSAHPRNHSYCRTRGSGCAAP